jgi:prepilin-type N-terminal cleavage/methylation domain-containing protein/prepilin-type processing-associated H-X9-DG protein
MHIDSKGRGRAFSLVELLVVIGIIAVLIGLLMPALAAARDAAKQTQCRANLRTIFLAAQLHENEHKGFMPAAGWHYHPVDGVVNPRGLGDDAATRYTYYDDGGVRRPAPLTVALAVSLGAKVRLDTRRDLEADMQTDLVRRYFRCPAQGEQLQGLTQKSSEPWTAPRDWSSYVFNEAVLGLRGHLKFEESTLGHATRVKRPDTVLFAMDGRPRNQENDNWLMVFDQGPEDTLWDFQQWVGVSGTGWGKQLLDVLRHRYRANLVFMDGHVETIALTRGGLESVGVSKGVRE